MNRAGRSRTLRAFLMIAVLALTGAPVFAQVQLKSRTIQPSGDTTAVFVEALRQTSGNVLHGLAVFSRQPSVEDRKDLAAAGIHLLAPLQGLTYRVRIEKRFDARVLASPDLAVSLIRLLPEDRVDPRLWRSEFSKFVVTPLGEKPRNYVLTAEGNLNLTVRFQRGVSEAESRSVLQRHALSFVRQSSVTWVAVMTVASLRSLAAEDIVQWIGGAPLPYLPENDRTRGLINVDTVQNFNATTGQVQGLGGNGVQVGIFDKGVDQSHGDFGTRVIRDDAMFQQGHATHVAGTVAGSGVLSPGIDSWSRPNGGTPYKWRGMAPLAQLIDADQFQGANTATYWDYITNQGMDLSNHSYSVSFDGDYDDNNQTRDEIIRGDAMSGTNLVPGRLHVYAAGNHGKQPKNGGNQIGYFSVTKQTKNGLLVGNWDADVEQIHQTSSLGPAHDGRIKPDVVAPGKSVISAGFCADGDAYPQCEMTAGVYMRRQNFYHAGTGSSMSSAATTGAVAVVLERYASTYGVDIDQRPPLPSTLRGVMIHTARDVPNIPLSVTPPTVTPPGCALPTDAWFCNGDGAVRPANGPDFVTGWGKIDAQAAVNVVAGRRLHEGRVNDTCETHTYLFRVLPGSRALAGLPKTPAWLPGSLRVTLAWDDIAGDSFEPDEKPKLVNDLDLVLIDPFGTEHYPWQLNQQILDPTGADIPNALQQCGSAIEVKRLFTPVAVPIYIPDDPAHSVNDTIPGGVVPVAVRGRDHLNNVEVVDTTAIAGVWQARVTGFNVREGPQSFSLIGREFDSVPIYPPAICRANPGLCEGAGIPVDLCRRFPKVCATDIAFPAPDRIRVKFLDLRQKIALPLDKICQYAINCPGCGAGGMCPAYDLQVHGLRTALGVEVYSAQGRLASGDRSAKLAKKLRFDARPGERYFVVVSPGPDTRLETYYDISLQLR